MRPGQNSSVALEEPNTSLDLTLPADKLPPVAGKIGIKLYILLYLSICHKVCVSHVCVCIHSSFAKTEV
jgi:hypothetical protein